MIREPVPPKRKSIPIPSSSDKGKGKMVDPEPELNSDDEELLTHVPFHYWPREKQEKFNEDAAKKF